ncbi:MAG: hypothetical protein A2504_13185 [Bdellovibrionales bacterium RIFOXYD12_FULL_39_22]|nr:MAG: hypothetical protein A2385_00985 [Bdellovibrionales bacterium RIFOXYB1_FULL_39_21]OFZ43581.1 MAG: hypothetical protein A2485_12655 [Bdellovibrionales bacterium RIFOXYC12_FULL_39_17]OFZ44600.1 MAG: hypothetical protein A2404_10345 [Bdellovibrionales bacterium RIFOXYC1_FULL_39_130]OFZ72397.1 MAG: hypothetical protein A2451_11480 [Bdellovibrionales bacterium RIFOXYC2_FULL_39_8]OFZ76359.1 MAG: hypothetical protein A2560_06965 [Bdellovibrionales bacterium RIFOXYD1_FULL_39_84]OFZ94625.1 MAG:
MNYQKIKSSLLVDLDEASLVSTIKKIQKIFISRQQIDSYMNDPVFVSAYTLFYMPSNLKKLSYLLKNMPVAVLHTLAQNNFIDYGCGPGTYAIALLNALGPENFHGKIVLIDKSPTMLAQARKVFETFHPTFTNYQTASDYHGSFSSNSTNNTLFFGNSANELGIHKISKIVQDISPQLLFLLEPGTHEIFSKLIIPLRQILPTWGYQGIYPCHTFNSPCPLDLRKDWCHQMVRSSYDDGIERLSQILSIDRRTMFMSSLVAQKKDAAQHFKDSGNTDDTKVESGIILRFLNETKHSFEYQICTDTALLLTLKIEIPKKTLSKKEIIKMKEMIQGTKIKFSTIKTIDENKHLRVMLK